MYKSKYANLMQHLMNEHDLILLDSEQQEIEKQLDKDLSNQLIIADVSVPKGTLPCDICGSTEEKKFDNPSCECVPNQK